MNELPSTYLKEAIETIEKEFTACYEEYIKFHKELDVYRGKEIGEDYQKVNEILSRIQFKFAELYPVLNFIGRRYEFAVNVTNEYSNFIEILKKAGGKEQSSIS